MPEGKRNRNRVDHERELALDVSSDGEGQGRVIFMSLEEADGQNEIRESGTEEKYTVNNHGPEGVVRCRHPTGGERDER